MLAVARAEEDLPPAVESLLSRVDQAVLEVPEPVYKWLYTFGTIISPTGESLKLQTPPLPEIPINGFPGFWGPVDENTHNLYEELPSLGLCHEHVRRSLAEPFVPNYISDLDGALNGNVIGFGRATQVCPSQRTYLEDVGYRPDENPGDTNPWGFSFQVLRRVSNAFVESSSETFRLTKWSVVDTNSVGSICQLTLWLPSTPPADPPTRIVVDESQLADQINIDQHRRQLDVPLAALQRAGHRSSQHRGHIGYDERVVLRHS